MIDDRNDLHPYNRKLDLMVDDAINSGEWEKPIRYATALITLDKTSKFNKKDMRFFLLTLLDIMAKEYK